MATVSKTNLRAEVAHYCFVVSGVLATLASLGAYIDWIPGKYGHAAVAFFLVIAILRAMVLKVEKRLEAPTDVLTAALGMSKDVEPDVQQLANAVKELSKDVSEFGPKKNG